MQKTKYVYSLLSIRNMFGLGHLVVLNAVTNNHVPTVYRGDVDNIDSYYTNSKGLSHFKSLSKMGTGGIGVQKLGLKGD
ncbi:hypothetical protein [Paenibacillus sp. FSL L8-0708]|uniref:hypothetical protein n=1 Tax=Paenibacillus sp. FSL L8-0708 TaxID=2975311 RepID=UPI0030FCC98F